MHSFMFTAAFERMRREIAEWADIQTVAHFGPGLFDIGNPGTLQTAAVVLQRKPAADGAARFFGWWMRTTSDRRWRRRSILHRRSK